MIIFIKSLLFLSLFVLSYCDNPFSTQPIFVSTQLDEKHNYRLPNNTRPLHYNIHLTTNIEQADFDFYGSVEITLEAVENTKNLTIHYRQLTINEVKLIDVETKKEIKFNEPHYDEITEHFVIPVESELVNGTQYLLSIEYNGTLRDDLAGFHKSSYTDDDGNVVWQAGTHFEPHNARHAFPCYDEPSIRTTFDIVITHSNSYHAVCNMPVKSIEAKENDMVATHFETTPKVQTYLIAFVVSDFSSVSFKKTDGILYNLYAKPSAIRDGQGDYGLFTGEKILTNQEKYFQTKFSLPQMSQIAMPNFGAGAMENWGIVIYMQDLLLYDESSENLQEKHDVGHIIGHEFAHQWFGDLVAPKWWNYLWLNEGFATLYASHTMSLVYPEYRDIDLFVLNNLQHAMRVDATGVSRPMTYYVENHRGISNLFDDIAYSKAASVLRMIQHSLTEETWKKGLKLYLDDMQYEAADSDDLARNLQEAASADNRLPQNLTMKELIDSWSLKGGYPVITVKRSNESTLIISQAKYVNTKKQKTDENWIIPINFATASYPYFNDTSPVAWMKDQTVFIKNDSFHVFNETDWIVFNIQETGYYRVNYDNSLWNLISNKLASDTFEEIHVINRAQIVDDVLNLARGEFVNYEICFRILEYLEHETDFLPWSSANNGLGYINRLMTGSENYANFQRFISKIVSPLYQSLGSHDRGRKDTLSEKRARTIAINWACTSGEESCINDTNKRVMEVLKNPSLEIEANVRSAIYCNGLRQTSQEEFELIWNRFINTSDQITRQTLINGMGCIQDAEIQRQNLNFTLESEEFYTKSEKTRLLKAIYNNGGRNGVESVIDFFSENFDEIDELYGEQTVRKNMYWMADKVTTKELYEKFEKLIDVLIVAQVLAENEREILMEGPKINQEWLKQNDEEIGKYFKSYFANDAMNLGSVSVIFLAIGVIFNLLI